MFNLTRHADDAVVTRASDTYSRTYNQARHEGQGCDESHQISIRAVLAELGPRADLAPVREDAPQLVSYNGRQYQIQGSGWVMQPIGSVTAREAERICRQALSGGLAAPFQESSTDPSEAERARGAIRRYLDAAQTYYHSISDDSMLDSSILARIGDTVIQVGHLRALLGSASPPTPAPRLAPSSPDDPLWTAASTFEAEVLRIAGDYVPGREEENGVALMQMREALTLALATRADAELCHDEGCPNAAEPHVCVSAAAPTRNVQTTAVNPTLPPSGDQRDALVETVRHVARLMDRDGSAATFNEAEQALTTYLARWPAADPPPRVEFPITSGRTLGHVSEIVQVAATAHRGVLRSAPLSEPQDRVDFDAMATALAQIDEITHEELAEVRRETAEVVALRAEAKELRAYLRAFVSATIDPHRRDMGEFLANPFLTYEFRHVDEDDTPEGHTITGGQVRRAAELIGYDVLRVAPPENTIAAELTEARDLRLEVRTMRERLARSEGALKKLIELRSPDEARKAAEADPVAAMDLPSVLTEDEYLIVSVKHTKEPNITFWSPNRRGYTTDLRNAGKYSMKEVYNATDPERLDSDRSFPVPSSVIWDALGRRFDLVLAPVRLLPVLEAAARVVLRAYADANPTTPAPTEES